MQTNAVYSKHFVGNLNTYLLISPPIYFSAIPIPNPISNDICRGGGVGVLVNENIKFFQRSDLSLTCESLEMVFIEIPNKKC